jgi:hypothetical protein
LLPDVQSGIVNIFASVNAVVMPEGKPLLGVIPLEFMDLIVDPTRQELVGANGDEALLMAMSVHSS